MNGLQENQMSGDVPIVNQSIGIGKRKLYQPGDRFGRLVIISFTGNRLNNIKLWNCLCDCGNTTIKNTAVLSSGMSKSCGCLKKEYHSKFFKYSNKFSKEYGTWSRIKTRCFNNKNKDYKYYGARGITVCDRWINSFTNFYNDIGPAPDSSYTIERINNDGNYEPSNCKWATKTEQNQNKRKRVPALTSYIASGGQRPT